VNRWIIPGLLALTVHGALFSLDLFSTRPVLAIRENRAVTISLASLSTPAPQPIISRSPSAIVPLTPLPNPQRPKPKRSIRPVPRPESQPEVPAAEAPLIDEAPPIDLDAADDPGEQPRTSTEGPDIQTASAVAADTDSPGPEQARVTASVPLYHLNPAPAYPAVARRRNYQGTVLIDVLVDRQGRAARVKVARSSGHDVLDDSALRSVRQWRFEPARRLGVAVEMWVQVPVRFVLD